MSTKMTITFEDLKSLVPKDVFDQIYAAAKNDAANTLLAVKLNDISDDIKQLLGTERTLPLAVDTASVVSVAPAVVPDTELDQDGIFIGEDIIEFLEIHGGIAASVINKRPIMAGVRSGYSTKAEPMLTILRGESYGLDYQLRNVFLTFKLFDDEPQIEGEYWESGFQAGPSGRKNLLTNDQVSQIIQTLVTKIREITAQNN